SYDERAGSFTTVATGFANALQHFGDILIAAGYNWECAEYAANSNPNKGIGPACPRTIPTEVPFGADIVVGVASSQSNGPGLQSDFPELYDKVVAKIAGGKVPDGDTDKLDRAAKAWRVFADSDPVFAGGPRLRYVADGLSAFDAPDVKVMIGHLRTLAESADGIRLAADDLAKSTDSHHVALAALRSEINTRVAATLVVASVVIAVTLVWIRNPRSATVEGTALET
ncbi:polymorphic toxin type 37 domain-containing protein, partial [Nocardia gipuzkoensis]